MTCTRRQKLEVVLWELQYGWSNLTPDTPGCPPYGLYYEDFADIWEGLFRVTGGGPGGWAKGGVEKAIELVRLWLEDCDE